MPEPVDWDRWDAHLGTVPDSQLARQIGNCTRQAVCDRRKKLNVKSYRQRCREELWWIHCLFSTMSDLEISGYAGYSPRTIAVIRTQQGVPKYCPVNYELIANKAGSASDVDVAREAGCHVNTVYEYRKEHDIPAYVPTGLARNGNVNLTADQVIQIRKEFDPSGKLIDQCRALAAKYGVAPSTVEHIVKGQTWQNVETE